MLKLENRRWLFFLVAPILMFFVAACTDVCVPLDVTPEHAINEVGARHTVFASLDEGDPNAYEGPFIAFFFVIFGPNTGANSLFSCDALSAEDCEELLNDCENEEVTCPAFICIVDPEACGAEDCAEEEFFEDFLLCIFLHCETNPDQCGDFAGCDPFLCASPEGEDVRWTYRSNGEEGTDYIIVCATPLGEVEEVGAQLQSLLNNRQILAQQMPTEPPDEDDVESIGCELVTKTWVDEEEEEDEEEDEDSPTRTPTPTPTKTPTPTPTITPTSQPSRLGVVDALFPGQRATPVPPTQSPAVAVQPQQQTAPSIVRPPNTGGAGLR